MSKKRKPRLLDLFCCEGGAAMGYHLAGFDVVGVDHKMQKRYPFEFHQADAVQFAIDHGREFDAIHASPPCQRHSSATAVSGNRAAHPCFIDATRDALQASGKPWIIENVPRSPLRDPITVCGVSLGLAVRRHRLFESNVFLMAPACACALAHEKKYNSCYRGTYGAGLKSKFVGVYGGTRFAGDLALRKESMEMPWATLHGVNQAVPPRYTRMLGAQLIDLLASVRT
jgi:DNA (cytosine-5)-methyltransferase 1